jgi:hypothetical protein
MPTSSMPRMNDESGRMKKFHHEGTKNTKGITLLLFVFFVPLW